MNYIASLFLATHVYSGEKISFGQYVRDDEEEGITFHFVFFDDSSEPDSIRIIDRLFRSNGILWLKFERNSWIFDADEFKKMFKEYTEKSWLNGSFFLNMEYSLKKDRNNNRSHCKFIMTMTESFQMNNRNKKIFLSHKGVDKKFVRKFKKALESVGLNPWMDEDAMPAGTPLHRGILEGFHNSCAAVFFVTPMFVDEQIIANEINYAMDEKQKKGNRFSIITLVFKNEDGKKGNVPELLRQYVWMEPDTSLEGFTEIIRALPLEVLEGRWKI
jgi:hypothetical protein